ncbi:MAG: helix-turn-helix transcriptional regulator [Pseudomonadales bacterium]|jgi:transcriptional regulator with XRE-family HTH domain|nr:helix-turn-helix transcriptional regulator [Pseudomonadales bacterium]MDP7359406.1 helix-turn-helix transcriptional regulator [Pseudomonadales bacterium]MDP7596386.1 helix-turn-helix transcriptional regulator [Pseudomonadales bacterium]HJN51046.1 helix-turn-helix transcriptional regulator [Pseudomonadales bacterium]|tara:strand:- start:945 stop:1448 length:504 start_codon:yes stop_codon:yes gene_type:complete
MYDNKSAPLIGPQIRKLRTGRGLTLQELARRAGTSASALHRYETGWDRFEIATLRRIATALGGHLEVRLLADDIRPAPTKPGNREILRLLAPLFWDKRLTSADLEDHTLWALCRVLMYGNRKQMQAMRRYCGDDLIRSAIAQRGVDSRTRSYWELILGQEHAPQSTQ